MTLLAHRFHGPRPQAGRPTLVLLHAYPLNSAMWDEVIEILGKIAPSVPILTLDAPGFGESRTGDDVAATLGLSAQPSLDTVAAAIEATLTELAIDDVILAGLSLGGYTALAYAEHYPGRLRGLGLLDTKAEADAEPARKVRIATAANVLTEGAALIEPSIEVVLGATTHANSPELVEALRAEILAAAPEAIAWIQRAMAARPERLHVLRELRLPVLVLRGDEDELSSPGSAHLMVAAAREGLPEAAVTLVTLPRTGHMAANEAPAGVAEALADLYERSGHLG